MPGQTTGAAPVTATEPGRPPGAAGAVGTGKTFQDRKPLVLAHLTEACAERIRRRRATDPDRARPTRTPSGV